MLFSNLLAIFEGCLVLFVCGVLVGLSFLLCLTISLFALNKILHTLEVTHAHDEDSAHILACSLPGVY
jgi:hypothetical protein